MNDPIEPDDNLEQHPSLDEQIFGQLGDGLLNMVRAIEKIVVACCDYVLGESQEPHS
jgi:hypothetical protein